MIPELASVYGLSPEEVWNMPQTQYARFLEHHEELSKASREGS